MKKFAAFLIAPALLAGPISCEAQAIYKCVAGANTTYQAHACEAGSAGKVLPIPAELRAVDATPANAAIPKPPEASYYVDPPLGTAIASNRRELQVGMSDLQVLNNRQWGRPLSINRNRDPRAWHEYWTYENPNVGAKKLHFVNGRLADIENAPTLVTMLTPGGQ